MRARSAAMAFSLGSQFMFNTMVGMVRAGARGRRARPALSVAGGPSNSRAVDCASRSIHCSRQGFPILRHTLGTQKVFGIFASVCFVAWLFILKFVPETMGTSLEQAGEAR